MKLFKLSQDINTGYDTYDSVVVAAPNPESAKQILPNKYCVWGENYSPWCSSTDEVTAEYLGEAVEDTEQGVILASFNAG